MYLSCQAERQAVREEEEREAATIAFDMFSASPTAPLPGNGPAQGGRGGGPGIGGSKRSAAALLEGDDPLLESNWDDWEGYYKTRIGEVIGGRCVCVRMVYVVTGSSLSSSSSTYVVCWYDDSNKYCYQAEM